MEQFLIKIRNIQASSHNMVWWKPEQIERGDHLRDDTAKGERPWIIPETTGRFLYDTITENNCTRVLELGTSIGYSTLWISHALSQHGGHVDTVELSDNKIPVARQNFFDMKLDQYITLHHTSIQKFLDELSTDIMYDLMFLDADRGHYHEYLPILERHLTPDGVIIADNAGNMQTRMQPFLDLLTERGFNWEILDIDNGLLVARKNPS